MGHIFQSIPVAVADSQYNHDGGELLDTVKEAAEQANPFDWPAAIGPTVDVIANRDFAGKPIVPRRVEGRLPQDQYAKYTTELMKIVGDRIGVSPAKLEHLVNSYSGGLYSRINRSVKNCRPERELVESDIPIIGTLFLRDPYIPQKQIRKFYDRMELLNQKKESDKITPAENRERLVFNGASRRLSPLWKKLRDAKTVDERKSLYSEIKEIITVRPLQQVLDSIAEGDPESEFAKIGIAKELKTTSREMKQKYPDRSEGEIQKESIQSVRARLQNATDDYGNAIKEIEYIQSLPRNEAIQKITARYKYMVNVDKALPKHGANFEQMEYDKVAELAINHKPTKSKFKAATNEAQTLRTCWYLDAAGVSEKEAARLFSIYYKGDLTKDSEIDKLVERTGRMTKLLREHRQSSWSIYEPPAEQPKPATQPQSIAPQPAPAVSITPPPAMEAARQTNIQSAQIRGTSRARVNLALMQGNIPAAVSVADELEQNGLGIEAIKSRIRIAHAKNDFATAKALTLQLT